MLSVHDAIISFLQNDIYRFESRDQISDKERTRQQHAYLKFKIGDWKIARYERALFQKASIP